MNPNISRLAKLPRGKAYRSRLIPHDADIWRWLAAGETYLQITLYLRERGLCVSVSAVHDYVAVRVRRRNQKGHVPGPSPELLEEPKNAAASLVQTQCQAEPGTKDADASTNVGTEFVFIPVQEKHTQLTSEDFALNDPTKYKNEKHSSSN